MPKDLLVNNVNIPSAIASLTAKHISFVNLARKLHKIFPSALDQFEPIGQVTSVLIVRVTLVSLSNNNFVGIS